MKPDWDKLTDEFKGSNSSGIYDVDCTGEGKDLCEKAGVSGYPTLKYGDPDNLQDYGGGRSFDELLAFAQEKLVPLCGPKQLDACSPDQQVLLEGISSMSRQQLEAKLAEFATKEKGYKKRRRTFNTKYSDFKAEKEELREQTTIEQAALEKFQKNKAKMSKAEIAKQEKKDTKAKDRKKKFEAKESKIEAEKALFETERKDLALAKYLKRALTQIVEAGAGGKEDL